MFHKAITFYLDVELKVFERHIFSICVYLFEIYANKLSQLILFLLFYVFVKTDLLILTSRESYLTKKRCRKERIYAELAIIFLDRSSNLLYMKKQPWLFFALITTIFWGIWGALIEIPEKAGFPATLGYIIWSLTMIPCALIGLAVVKWKFEYDRKSVIYGGIIGFLGAGGQLVLFHALEEGPAYLVFPIISLSPTVTVLFSVLFLKESTNKKHWIGIITALVAILLMSYQEPQKGDTYGFIWFILAFLVFLSWGIQAFFIKLANNTMKAESIFFYMMITGVLLTPVAYLMTDFSQPIYWGFNGPYLNMIIMTFNSIGALTIVYAIRYGKVIIVAPLTNAGAPLITILLSLLIYQVIPNPVILTGMVITLISVYFIAD